MNIPPYRLNSSEDKLLFEFESVGQTTVTKVIEYKALAVYPNIYNLGLGDKRHDGSIDDMAITDNGDMETVIATVIESMREFFVLRPQKIIFFTGSDAVRTRLYNGIINKFSEKILEDYELFGLINTLLVRYEKGKIYEGFFVKHR